MRQAIDDYVERLVHYGGLDETELPDVADVELAGLVRAAAGPSHLVALDSRGKELDSVGFAQFVGKLQQSGKGEIAFVIGGKEGLGPTVLGACGHTLSLSRLTLPHRLARLFLAEQLYRAMTILRGEPYGL